MDEIGGGSTRLVPRPIVALSFATLDIWFSNSAHA